MQYYLGLDLGTGGVRALAVSESGTVIASGSAAYPLLTPHPNWAEQLPGQWWEGTVKAVRQCLEKVAAQKKGDISVAAIGLTGQMHGSVFLDGKGEVLRPAILWCDQRTEEQCRSITDLIGFDRLIALTSNRALAGFTAPKILWLNKYEPDTYAKVRQMLLPKDYIRYRLSGLYATEVSDASGTLLFNVMERKWSNDMLQALEIPATWLPPCFESTVISSRLGRQAAAELGLPAGIPIAGGGGDQAAGAVGNGVVEAGMASCVIGTSGVLFWSTDKPVYDPQGRLHAFCHASPGKWHLMGVTLAAGGSLRWFRDTLCQDIKAQAEAKNMDPYVIIDEMAAKVPSAAEGLFFAPYLAGERTPYANAAARGAFLGLSLRHDRAFMARAVLEGITMSLKDCIELGRQCGITTSQVRISGGGARSALWRQLVADIFEMSVTRAGVDEGAAYGAAIIAAVGSGLYETVEQACSRIIRIPDTVEPDNNKFRTYRAQYDVYRSLYSRLKSFHDADAEFTQQLRPEMPFNPVL